MPHNKNIYLKILLALVILLGASSSYGQIIYGQPVTGDLQFFYSHFKLESDAGSTTINQFVIPVGGFIPLGDNFEGRFYIANAANKLEYADTDYKLNGLSDMRLQVNHSFAEDRLLISAGVNLPTGKKKLNITEEWLVLEFLSQNYLNFPLRRLGEGLGLNLLVGGATMAGDIRLGGAVEYQYNGSYEPYDIGGDYKPGNHFSVNAGADTKRGRMSYSAGIIYTIYSDDKFEDVKIFSQSSQLDFRLSGVYEAERFDISATTRYLIRDRNKRYNPIDGSVLEQLKAYGNEFLISGRLTYRPEKKWFIAPTADLRLIATNEYDSGNADIIGFGIDSGRNIGEGINLGLGLKYYTGSADGGDIDISGYQLSAGLTANF
ncbi:MAG: hypothetical protein JXA92_03400 [candidate division Zixibacteria bacterium]|nr:hypothetical protein [candidate division Zixibacteria bacterium]